MEEHFKQIYNLNKKNDNMNEREIELTLSIIGKIKNL